MTDETWLGIDKTPAIDEIAFDYIKSSDFRVVWADGAIGSVTPHGLIHLALYSERLALPRRQVFKINSEQDSLGPLGKEVLEKQISRGSIVREMACDVFLNIETTKNLVKFLSELIDSVENTGE